MSRGPRACARAWAPADPSRAWGEGSTYLTRGRDFPKCREMEHGANFAIDPAILGVQNDPILGSILDDFGSKMAILDPLGVKIADFWL